ncbi:MAG: hypothetical protein NTZ95_08065 [Candidatus Omnitrophica bacterium]|nr:hypothetical protein [Candidatus Omnitrophota bacterium]
MRLVKSILPIMIFTVASLMYVHQQVELVKLSYNIEKKEKKLNEVLDRREQLSYNIKNLEAPSRLESALLAKNIDITFPRKGNVIQMARPYVVNQRGLSDVRSTGLEKRFNIFGFLDFLTPKAEAHQAED